MRIPPIVFGADDPQFVVCLPPVIEQEGYPGNDDDPHDPGGRTHAGIIQREYNAFRRRKGLPSRDVWRADWDEVCEIYHEQYWLPWCPKLWAGINLMYFDQSVNQGPVQATRNLQRAINAHHDPGYAVAALRAIGVRASSVMIDGHLGMETLGAVNAVKDRVGLLHDYLNQDIWFYRRLKGWIYYGRGWTRRAKEIHARATSLIGASMA